MARSLVHRTFDKAKQNLLTLVLAGGQGERLYPLTKDRAKPSVPFGGLYRIIDFTLSNVFNSDFRRAYVLTQYKSESLDRHIKLGWNIFLSERNEFIDCVPPQFRRDNRWYEGTADAIYHNVHLLQPYQQGHVLILSGDHIYKMDYRRMLEAHLDTKAAVTLAAVDIPPEEAYRFGIIETDASRKIVKFHEKPKDISGIPKVKGKLLGSMGVYIFNTEILVKAVSEDAKVVSSSHDFGKDILPTLLPTESLYVFPFEDAAMREGTYWRDVGTIDTYYETNMDLVSVTPSFNLYDEDWPARTFQPQAPPAKTVFTDEWPGGRVGKVLGSMICPGVIVSGGRVFHSILGSGVRVNSYSNVEDSILFNGVDVGRHARIRRAIVDKGVKIPEGFQIGYDREADARRFTISPGGIVVVPKGTEL